MRDVVGVHHREPARPAPRASAALRVGDDPGVRPRDHAQARIARGVALEDRERAVARAVVDRDQLEVAERLGEDALERRARDMSPRRRPASVTLTSGTRTSSRAAGSRARAPSSSGGPNGGVGLGAGGWHWIGNSASHLEPEAARRRGYRRVRSATLRSDTRALKRIPLCSIRPGLGCPRGFIR